MSLGRLAAVIALITALVFQTAPQAAGATCADYKKQMIEAELAADARRAEALLDELYGNNACNVEDGALKLMEWAAARAHFANIGRQGDASAQEQQIRAALKIGRPWQLETALGDILFTRKQYGEASLHYQAALDDIRDEILTRIAPGPAIIASVYKKAEDSRLLASEYVEVKDSRGEPGGLAYSSVRGFTAEKTAIPIEFETAKTSFTAKGQKAVADMLDYLRRANSPSIHLIGHTDERGDDAYNLKLSRDRATALRDHLEKNGYPRGRIEISGLGETMPYQPANAESLTQDETWQVNRRVELQRR